MHELTWTHPESFPGEKASWLAAILRNNYGIPLLPKPGDDPERHHIFLSGQRGKITMVRADSKEVSKTWWPVQHIETDIPLCSRQLPVLKHRSSSPHDFEDWSKEVTLDLSVDIFGTIFFILSREEELSASTLDEYGRFSAKASDAYKRNYLDRPVVDEYVEVLWAYIRRIWPAMSRKPRKGSISYSCDVDVPFDPGASGWVEFTKRLSADLIIRKSPRSALQRYHNIRNVKKGHIEKDPHYQFNFILDQLEKNQQKATFYFLSSPVQGKGTGWYAISDPKITALLKTINDAGHHIGLHGSFGSHLSAKQYEEELHLLEQTCSEAGIDTNITRNRQHFLRFDIGKTPDLLESCGIRFDSSGGYPDCAGFRFGTAIPFPMWSWRQSKALKLIQEPLICMECSLLLSKYMGLPHYPEAFEYGSTLKQRALAFGGDFTLLWHNNNLKSPVDRELLSNLIAPLD